MLHRWYHRFAAASVFLSVTAALGVAGIEIRPLSPRNANYTIEVRLDPEARTLDGSQILTWRNIQAEATDELWFHLYWNAWRNDQSTWMRESRRLGREKIWGEIREEDWGSLEIASIRLLGDDDTDAVDLGPSVRYESPDDGNPWDRTVVVAELPRAVEPGETVRVAVTWNARIPAFFARTGHRGDFFFFAHWFPKLGVFGPEGWNSHQFHVATEFFSDYGIYDVTMTVPADWVVGATGLERDRRRNDDGTMTHRYYEEDVHGFAWTTSPDFVVRTTRFEEPGLSPVDVRFLAQPEHLDQVERHLDAARNAFKYYGTWYGAYPYGHVTIVDPPYGSRAGGMEYPTLFTCGTRLFNPRGGKQPESVTVHEAGHQFWYGVVGNNEFEHAWLDEGLNTFSQLRTLEAAYPDLVWVNRYLPAPGYRGRRNPELLAMRVSDITIPRFVERVDMYRPNAAADDLDRPTFRYLPYAASDLSYSKTALWLATLERHIGWDALQRILSTFYDRHAFGHPTPEDFFTIANEVSGQDLTWFFDQIRGSAWFDYAVDSVASVPLDPEGLTEREGKLVFVDPAGDDDGREEVYRSEVVVRRHGDGHFPVDVLLVFEDGYEIRESWDGRARWRLFAAERPARLRHAIVDPERTLLLDLRYNNNSMTMNPGDGFASKKWAAKWMVWLQDLLASFEYFM
jgi:hypothetical protein